MKNKLDITPSPRLLQVLGDIPLQNWQCLAELIDNSLDELLKQPNRSATDPLRVDISIEPAANGVPTIVVRDNGTGMTEDELERSLRAGHSSKGRYGTLGLFGMGFNIATSRLGDITTVETTTAGSDEMLSATINFAELQREETFSVPLARTKCDASITGTTVRIQLKRPVAEDLARPVARQGIVKQLGDVYSYLLRDAVPGINRPGLSSRIPARITFNGELIEAGLHCIWSDQRKVISGGVEVHAVQYIDESLTSATACLDCGYWDRKNGPVLCEECGSPNLDVRNRRIWGWLGVQRYIDSSHYGIDFVRYGRKILTLDKTIFTYQNTDTLETEIEYPIEMPANQGRIVGEIHLDHVPVTYQKNDFNRQSLDWQTAIEKIRGTGPLKPRGASIVNSSPLARLYAAFRRNDPGTRYLTAGDGERAIHSKSREWAQYFVKGIARYRDDTEWFEAAERHQNIKDGTEDIPNQTQTTVELSDSKKTNVTADGAVANLIEKISAPTLTPAPKQSKQLTEKELLDKARILGTRREDLSGSFNLGRELGSWKITVITTKERLDDHTGKGSTPVRPGILMGAEIEVFVWDEHPIFREFGRDSRDAALMRIAEMIKGLTSSSLSVVTIYGELVQAIPDLKTTDVVITDRISRTFERISELMSSFVYATPQIFWDLLDAQNKAVVENKAAVMLPSVGLEEIVDDGRYIHFVDADGLLRILEKKPEAFFDGKVFKPKLLGRSPSACARVLSSVVRAIGTLNDFQTDALMRQKHDMALASIMLEFIEAQLSSEDLHT
jgi:hypothetical protein